MKKHTERGVRAWAIVDGGLLCQHEETMSIYPTRKEARKGMFEKDGMPKCSGDKVFPCTITYSLPSKKRLSKGV